MHLFTFTLANELDDDSTSCITTMTRPNGTSSEFTESFNDRSSIPTKRAQTLFQYDDFIGEYKTT